MRAHTNTSTIRSRRSARSRVLALVLGICALAIPATASASRYSSVNAITGGSEASSQPASGSDFSSLNAITGESSKSTSTVRSPHVAPKYSSLNAVTGPPTGEPTVVSWPLDTADGFDWPSAAVGAGGALALVAFGSAAFLTVRRRTAVSPSTSTS